MHSLAPFMLSHGLTQCLHTHTLMLAHVHILSPIYKFIAQFLTHIHTLDLHTGTHIHTLTLTPAHS